MFMHLVAAAVLLGLVVRTNDTNTSSVPSTISYTIRENENTSTQTQTQRCVWDCESVLAQQSICVVRSHSEPNGRVCVCGTHTHLLTLSMSNVFVLLRHGMEWNGWRERKPTNEISLNTARCWSCICDDIAVPLLWQLANFWRIVSRTRWCETQEDEYAVLCIFHCKQSCTCTECQHKEGNEIGKKKNGRTKTTVNINKKHATMDSR